MWCNHGVSLYHSPTAPLLSGLVVCLICCLGCLVIFVSLLQYFQYCNEFWHTPNSCIIEKCVCACACVYAYVYAWVSSSRCTHVVHTYIYIYIYIPIWTSCRGGEAGRQTHRRKDVTPRSHEHKRTWPGAQQTHIPPLCNLLFHVQSPGMVHGIVLVAPPCWWPQLPIIVHWGCRGWHWAQWAWW
jgi:hypothetical protein